MWTLRYTRTYPPTPWVHSTVFPFSSFQFFLSRTSLSDIARLSPRKKKKYFEGFTYRASLLPKSSPFFTKLYNFISVKVTKKGGFIVEYRQWWREEVPDTWVIELYLENEHITLLRKELSRFNKISFSVPQFIYNNNCHSVLMTR